ncbi:hypothetical protein PWT90_04655 [Aphanocladium album]|nr:hypothetical protein PWT90_04655 [Aphanocladium album]
MVSEQDYSSKCRRNILDYLHAELLIYMLSQLDTLRDAQNFASTSRRCQQFMGVYGWEKFLKLKFPSIRVPDIPEHLFGWQKRAEKLAMIDQAWERRSFDIYSYGEHPLAPWGGKYFRRGGSGSITHATPIDARLIPNTMDEIVACGAGEDLMVRRSAIHGRTPTLWAQHLGEDSGFYSGKGDITALSVVHRWSGPEIITGRANGEFHLHRFVDNRVQSMTQLSLSWGLKPDEKSILSQTASQFTLDKTHVSSMHWQPTHNLLATAQNATLQLWVPPAVEEPAEIHRVGSFSITSSKGSGSPPSSIRAVKFLDDVNIACGVEGTESPLRGGRITPYGLRMQSAPRDPHDLHFGANSVNAVESVGKTGNLVLSAWNDGTLRLTDFRTAKPYESIYRNGNNPRYVSGSLITHGLERFVAGSSVSPDLHFFDYRNPSKAYFYIDAMPCSGNTPYPGYNLYDSVTSELPGRTKCRPSAGISCRWHRESRRSKWRPDATMRVYNLVFERVTALARSCDLSDAFYTGMQGGLLEVRLAEDLHGSAFGGEHILTAEMSRSWDGSAKSRAWSRKHRPNALITMEETGNGRYSNLFSLLLSLERDEIAAMWDKEPDAMFLDQTGWTMRSKFGCSKELESLTYSRLQSNWLRNRHALNKVPIHMEPASPSEYEFGAESGTDDMRTSLDRMQIQ